MLVIFRFRPHAFCASAKSRLVSRWSSSAKASAFTHRSADEDTTNLLGSLSGKATNQPRSSCSATASSCTRFAQRKHGMVAFGPFHDQIEARPIKSPRMFESRKWRKTACLRPAQSKCTKMPSDIGSMPPRKHLRKSSRAAVAQPPRTRFSMFVRMTAHGIQKAALRTQGPILRKTK